MSDRIFISSKNRDNYETTNAGNCQISTGSQVSGKYALVNGALTNSVYTVTSATNSLVFSDSGGSHTASITAGYYTANGIAAAVETALNAVGAATYTVTYSSATGKLTIGHSVGCSFTYAGSTIAPIVGLTADRSSSASHTFDRPIDLSYNFSTAFVYISQAKSFNSRLGNSQSNYNFAITVDEDYGGLVSLKNIEVPGFIDLNNSNLLNIEIRNSSGTVVDMNGGYFEFEFKKIPE